MGAMKQRRSVREMFALGDVDIQSADGLYDAPFPEHVASDSRNVRPGGVFVALEGERVDGHNYIEQAVRNGAGLIVGRKGKCSVAPAVPCVELDEPERQMGEISARYLEYVSPREVVAVTGSVGKTTTREAIRRVLDRRFRVHAAERSFNTVIGCSATVLAMPPDTEILLLEFGASSMGEIENLARLYPPSVALVTQVAPVHLEGFGSFENVLEAKMEITKSDRLRYFIYHGDSDCLRGALPRLSRSVRALGVGFERGEYRITNTEFNIKDGKPSLSLTLSGPEAQTRRLLRAGVWGEKLALPVAMAAVLGDITGVPREEGAMALADFSGLKGRGRICPLGSRFLVDDAYNANPVSMRSSLETFLSLDFSLETEDAKGKKFAVLGDMRELGEDGVRWHEELRPLVEKLDRVIFVGNLWKEALSGRGVATWHFVEKQQNVTPLLQEHTDWKALLVKGSNSLRMEDLVERLLKNPTEDLPGKAVR